MKSLHNRLLFIVLAVALFSVTTTAWVTQEITRSKIETFLAGGDLPSELEIHRQVETFGRDNSSWDGVQEIIERLADDHEARVVLIAEDDNAVLADTKKQKNGKPQYLPLTAIPVEGKRHLSLLHSAGNGEVPISDESESCLAEQFETINEETIGGGLELQTHILDVPFACLPTNEILSETGIDHELVERCYIDSNQPFYYNLSGLPISTEASETGLDACLRSGFNNPTGDRHYEACFKANNGAAQLQGALTSSDPSASCTALAYLRHSSTEQLCLQKADIFLDTPPQEKLSDYNLDNISTCLPPAPAARLHIGPRPTTSTTLFTDGLAQVLLLVVLLVLAASAAVSWITFRRLVTPVAQLSTAAARMGSGELSTRVEENSVSELQQLASSFNQMAADLEYEDNRRKQFTSDVAHELRTPLANIRGYLEAAQDGLASIDRPFVDSLHEDTLVIQRLVDDLQILTLAEGRTLTVEPQPVLVADTFDLLAHQHKPKTDKANVSLTTKANKNLIAIADPVRLRQVLGNLINNAIRHTPRHGAITMSATQEAQTVLISVADTGEGIPAEHLPRVFDRFYRVDSSRTRQSGGSGLGLAISRELTIQQGGKISATSVVGKGSVFTVQLPLGKSRLL